MTWKEVEQWMDSNARWWTWSQRAIRGTALAFLVAAIGCTISQNVDQDQRVIVTVHPPQTPTQGCTGIALGAEPVDGDTVTLSIASDQPGPFLLTIDGASAGPASDGQDVTLDTGTHTLQVVAGACVSNTLTAVAL